MSIILNKKQNMIIKLTTGKSKSFASLEEALEYCAECTCFMYYISIKDEAIVALGNGVEFKVASIYRT